MTAALASPYLALTVDTTCNQKAEFQNWSRRFLQICSFLLAPASLRAFTKSGSQEQSRFLLCGLVFNDVQERLDQLLLHLDNDDDGGENDEASSSFLDLFN